MSLPGKRPVVRICIAIAAISFCALAITHITHAISSSSTSPDSVEEATGYSCHDLEVAHINDIELEGDESLFLAPFRQRGELSPSRSRMRPLHCPRRSIRQRDLKLSYLPYGLDL